MNETQAASSAPMDQAAESTPILELRGLYRNFLQGERRIEVLRGADLVVAPGEAVALLGPSGSGKSTLLHIAGLLERADRGEVMINGRDCTRLSDSGQTLRRRQMVGFVYQSHRLLPEFSAIENVMVPQLIAGLDKHMARQRAEELLSMMNLSERITHAPSELSGGEQQRVAIARAVANAPSILLADEPTGNLDPKTAERVFKALMALVAQSGLAAVIATHNHELARKMDRCVMLSDGILREVRIES